jgi:MA3 domain
MSVRLSMGRSPVVLVYGSLHGCAAAVGGTRTAGCGLITACPFHCSLARLVRRAFVTFKEHADAEPPPQHLRGVQWRSSPRLLSVYLSVCLSVCVLENNHAVHDAAAVEGTMVAEVRLKCESLLSARHAAERLLRCWGNGAGLVFEDTRDAVRKMLSEYRASHDIAEAGRCLRNLAVPFFHHEFVKQVWAGPILPGILSSVVEFRVVCSLTSLE